MGKLKVGKEKENLKKQQQDEYFLNRINIFIQFKSSFVYLRLYNNITVIVEA